MALNTCPCKKKLNLSKVILSTLFFMLILSVASAQTIIIPEEKIELKSWNEPHEQYHFHQSSHGNSWYYGEKSVPATSMIGENYYGLSKYIYYRVLIYPDGSEEIIDQYLFDNKNTTETVDTNCKWEESNSGGSDRGWFYFLRRGCAKYKYYSKHTIPEKTLDVDVDEEGTYKIQLRKIEIPITTAEKYLMFVNPNEKIDLNSVIDLYEAERYKYHSYGYDLRGNNYYTYREVVCTETTKSEYENTHEFDVMGLRMESVGNYPGASCSMIEKQRIDSLGCKFQYHQRDVVTSCNNGICGGHMYEDDYCWIEGKTISGVKLTDLAEPVVEYEYEIEGPAIMPIMLMNKNVFNPNSGNDGPTTSFTETTLIPPDSGSTNPINSSSAAVGALALLSSIAIGNYIFSKKGSIAINEYAYAQPDVVNASQPVNPYYYTQTDNGLREEIELNAFDKLMMEPEDEFWLKDRFGDVSIADGTYIGLRLLMKNPATKFGLGATLGPIASGLENYYEYKIGFKTEDEAFANTIGEGSARVLGAGIGFTIGGPIGMGVGFTTAYLLEGPLTKYNLKQIQEQRVYMATPEYKAYAEGDQTATLEQTTMTGFTKEEIYEKMIRGMLGENSVMTGELGIYDENNFVPVHRNVPVDRILLEQNCERIPFWLGTPLGLGDEQYRCDENLHLHNYKGELIGHTDLQEPRGSIQNFVKHVYEDVIEPKITRIQSTLKKGKDAVVDYINVDPWGRISYSINSNSNPTTPSFEGIDTKVLKDNANEITKTSSSFSGGITSFKSTISNISSTLSNTASSISSNISSGLESISSAISSGINSIQSSLSNTVSNISSTLSSVAQNVTNTASNAWDTFTSWFN